LRPGAGSLCVHHEAVRPGRSSANRREGSVRRNCFPIELTVIQTQLAALVRTAIERAQESGDLPGFDVPPVQMERPARKEHGDWSTGIALVASKEAKMKPRDLAETIVAALGRTEAASHADLLAGIEVAGPGFINFRLS